MERPWLILCRVLHVAPPAGADLGMHAHAAEHDAAGEVVDPEAQEGVGEADEVEEHGAGAGEAEEHVVAAVDAAAAAQHPAVGAAEEEDAQAAQQAQDEQHHAGVGEAAEQHVDAAAEAQHAAGVGEAAEQHVDAAAEAQHAAGVGEAEEHAAVVGDQEAADLLQAQLEESVVNVNTNAAASQAAHAAHGAAAPDFTITVAAPASISTVIAGPGPHPDPERRDAYPYIIAAGRFCLLAHFSVAPAHGTHFDGEPIRSHLVVVRHFRRRAAVDDGGGWIAACAVRVPNRPDNVPNVANIDSVALLCNQETGHYQIVELVLFAGAGFPVLIYMSSDTGAWQWNYFVNPLAATGNPHRVWVPHGTVSINSTIMWYDLSWGIISCDLAQHPLQQQLIFHRLPRGRVLRGGVGGGAMPELDLHSSRCIAVSENLVRYVEIIVLADNPPEAATVNMWYRDIEDNPDRWITNYREISFGSIWDDDTYVQTTLPRNPPMLVGVSPVDSNVVYFTLNNRIFGVNVPEHRVVDCQDYEPLNRPGPPDEPVSGRFLITWNLDANGAINVGHQQNEYPDHGDSSDDGALDEGEIDYQTPSE